MKKLMSMLLTALMLTGCSSGGKSSNTYRQISMDEAVTMMERETDYIILDVHRPDEYATGHIPGSVNIDVKKGHEELATVLDPERPVALYCRSGRRSENAGWVLEKVFFKNVVDLEGGYNAWMEYHGNGK